MKDDEWMMMNEGWMKNDEGWWFQAVEGFWLQTDPRTLVNVESLLQLKIEEEISEAFSTFTTAHWAILGKSMISNANNIWKLSKNWNKTVQLKYVFTGKQFDKYKNILYLKLWTKYFLQSKCALWGCTIQKICTANLYNVNINWKLSPLDSLKFATKQPVSLLGQSSLYTPGLSVQHWPACDHTHQLCYILSYTR